jgi:hypothetical protein
MIDLHIHTVLGKRNASVIYRLPLDVLVLRRLKYTQGVNKIMETLKNLYALAT